MIQPAKPDLVTVIIDGKEISVPKGTNVIEAARQLQTDIPHYCYHPKLIARRASPSWMRRPVSKRSVGFLVR